MTEAVNSADMATNEVVDRIEHTTSCLAVIVTYNAELTALTKTILALHEQDCVVLVVDNGSANQHQLELQIAGLNQQQQNQQFGQTQLICNSSNQGLGAAHNQGYAFAKQYGHSYLLILDQDSVPLDNLVSHLLQAHQTLSQTHAVSAVGACYLNAENQSESFFVRFGALKFQREYAEREYVPADFLISSGSLFSISTLDSIGGMDESLFIDHVDTEWFLRARNLGYRAFGVSAARMQHGLGESTHQFRVGGRQRNVPQHKPFRYYYIFRNSILLYKRGYTAWLWKWNDVQRLAMIFVMFGLLKAPRWQNLKMMTLGLWHGLLGRSGVLVGSRGIDTKKV